MGSLFVIRPETPDMFCRRPPRRRLLELPMTRFSVCATRLPRRRLARPAHGRPRSEQGLSLFGLGRGLTPCRPPTVRTWQLFAPARVLRNLRRATVSRDRCDRTTTVWNWTTAQNTRGAQGCPACFTSSVSEFPVALTCPPGAPRLPGASGRPRWQSPSLSAWLGRRVRLD
jgi:hypothetical protein